MLPGLVDYQGATYRRPSGTRVVVRGQQGLAGKPDPCPHALGLSKDRRQGLLPPELLPVQLGRPPRNPLGLPGVPTALGQGIPVWNGALLRGEPRRLLLEQDQLGEGARNLGPSSQVGAVEHLTRAGEAGQIRLAIGVKVDGRPVGQIGGVKDQSTSGEARQPLIDAGQAGGAPTQASWLTFLPLRSPLALTATGRLESMVAPLPSWP